MAFLSCSIYAVFAHVVGVRRFRRTATVSSLTRSGSLSCRTNAFLPPPTMTGFTSCRNYSDKKMLEAVDSEIEGNLASNQQYKAGSPTSSAYLKSPPPMRSDICQGGGNEFSTWKKLLSKEVEEQGSQTDQPSRSIVLRPGMVLLKRFLTLDEQVLTVRECRRLGLGPGGFYWPNMHMMRMCLGLDWDSQLGKYTAIRRFDNSEVPDIPLEFIVMVRRAMDSAQAITKREHGARNVENILPMMIPDVCLLNFYTPQGQLGVHQDRDESGESLSKGLPIVSFSIGDSAMFVYGDGKEKGKEKKARKEKKASLSEEFFYGNIKETRKAKKKKAADENKVVLESGDVLIFGGPARHIFHGVRSVVPRTAPSSLLKETSLLPGRLNLTFRQF